MSGDPHDISDTERGILRTVRPYMRQDPKREHDRKVMNSVFFVVHAGTLSRDIPERCAPYTTCCNRWSRNGAWA